ncbi:MAG: DUF5107 domain-containing protein [Planctomycetota bacterium]|nr:DUF5107 domain-containing protein [Planctomycetota bacterium]
MSFSPVSLRREKVVIPTYPVGKPDRNPMFLEKRVYQGSSGKVYPLPTIDTVGDEREDREYLGLILENDFLYILILPELGGRIQRALDKTNNYDFVYYNQVIKPALVGLAGPWISGGIEFNWPQHHRPSTFLPVSYDLVDNADGSKTAWVGEIDRIYGTKGMAGFTLYPDRAYLEIRGRLYNGTLTNQSFLWWANPAVAVNDKTRSIFPTDVHAVFDHGKRDVSKFPIATGVYYKQDYSEGVDIACYRNIPVPTSYMAYHSDFNFVGGYDYGVEAGVLHVANHHQAPGKKQWTWGNADFGQAWDRNLTDQDGPYIELMTGVYTDNQPDFTWLIPGETKTFTQYFLPYKQLGQITDANERCLTALAFPAGSVQIGVYAPVSMEGWRLKLIRNGEILHQCELNLKPGETYHQTLATLPGDSAAEWRLRIKDAAGVAVIDYRSAPAGDLAIPEPARAVPPPEEIRTNEELYLTGIHLEQYRHATYLAEDYYTEGLRRDPGDFRLNSAYADLMLRRGCLGLAESHYRAAVARSNLRNANPRDGEAHYGLGLTLKMTGRLAEAENFIWRATWDGTYAARGYATLAQIAFQRFSPQEALDLAGKSLALNVSNSRARQLQGLALRRLGRFDEAVAVAEASLSFDPLDWAALNELSLAREEAGLDAGPIRERLQAILNGEARNYLELAFTYEDAGAWREAVACLAAWEKLSPGTSPEVLYHLGYCQFQAGAVDTAMGNWEQAEKAAPDYCFPNRLHTLLALETVITARPVSPRAHYYLGCLLYDARRHADAARHWETSARLDPSFPTVFRNLALYYFNKQGAAAPARELLEKAFNLDKGDARVLFELDQLYKKLAVPHQERLALLDRYPDLVAARDDLYIESVTLLNLLGRHREARERLAGRHFHPWEGGEGKTVGQYVLAEVELAKTCLRAIRLPDALEHLQAAKNYPLNLGEGKLPGAAENQIDYLIGLVRRETGDLEGAKTAFQAAATGSFEPAGMMFYNDQPADSIYYQGLAWLELGDRFQANKRFHRLYDYGEKHLADQVRIDYFAVSLPDFLVFDEDLGRKNLVYCRYLMGLAKLGLGQPEEGEALLAQAADLDPNHPGPRFVWKKT